MDIYGLSGFKPEPGSGSLEGYNLCNSPFSVKATGDRAFCDGLQHIAFHVYTLQPPAGDGSIHVWNGVGLHFNRNITWWDQAHAFNEYLARCSAIFQQGSLSPILLTGPAT